MPRSSPSALTRVASAKRGDKLSGLVATFAFPEGADGPPWGSRYAGGGERPWPDSGAGWDSDTLGLHRVAESSNGGGGRPVASSAGVTAAAGPLSLSAGADGMLKGGGGDEVGRGLSGESNASGGACIVSATLTAAGCEVVAEAGKPALHEGAVTGAAHCAVGDGVPHVLAVAIFLGDFLSAGFRPRCGPWNSGQVS